MLAANCPRDYRVWVMRGALMPAMRYHESTTARPCAASSRLHRTSRRGIVHPLLEREPSVRHVWNPRPASAAGPRGAAGGSTASTARVAAIEHARAYHREPRSERQRPRRVYPAGRPFARAGLVISPAHGRLVLQLGCCCAAIMVDPPASTPQLPRGSK